MTTFFTVMSYIFGTLLFIAVLASIVILLVAVFRSLRQMQQYISRRDAMTLSLLKANLDQLQIQNTMMIRYEKNLANWYNAQTGDSWKIDTDLKAKSAANKNRLEELAQIIQEEQDRLKP